MSMRLSAAAIAIAAVLVGPATAQTPDYYPADYSATIDAAKAEGRVVVYGTFDPEAFAPFAQDFQALYPGITVDYNSMSSSPLHSRVLSEVAANSATADLVLSSAVDRQMSLLNDGYALEYSSPEKAGVPEWAVWKDQGYSMTMDPIVFVYNKSELSEDQVPKSHAELADVIGRNADLYNGRIILSDIRGGGVNAVFLAGDVDALGDGLWVLQQAMKDQNPIVSSGSSTILESVGAGESVFAYNMQGGYSRQVAGENPSVGVIIPNDYALAVLRPMYISKAAANQNAAKLLLDYLLSHRAQSMMLSEGMYPVRADVEGEGSTGEMIAKLGDGFRPILMGSSVLETLANETSRQELIQRWISIFGS